MKHYLSGIAIALSLALVLVLGVVALAENAPQVPELPAANELQNADEAPDAAQAPENGVPAAQDDNTALQEALQAYNAARESSREQALQDELDGYVTAGKLTQEQADLIMKYYRDRQAQRNGTCPGRGDRFRNGMNGHGGKGGMNGKGFGRSGKDGRMNDGFGGGMMPGIPDGTSALPGAQAAPQMAGDEGI